MFQQGNVFSIATQRIAGQRAPDGAPYEKRKQRKNLRGKKGKNKTAESGNV
jgi:hypothetical protein